MSHDWNIEERPHYAKRKVEINKITHEVSEDAAAIAHALMCLTSSLEEFSEDVYEEVRDLRIAIEAQEED
jgi:hypothetical protein